MRPIIFSIILLILPFYIFSQDYQNAVKKKIGFIPYTDPGNADAKFRELAYKNIYDAALRVFVNTQRFEVLDRGSFDIIKIEKEFQQGEDFANVEIAEQGRTSAAQLLAVAKLSTFKITESDDGNGYSVYITAEFKQIDVESGRATSAFQLVAEAKDGEGGGIGGLGKNKRIATREEAISKAVNIMEEDLARWIKLQWPLILKVYDVESGDRVLVIDGGRNVGLNEKHKMKAITLKVYPNGKKLINTIGKLNFTKEGPGEELTSLKMGDKKAWDNFMKLWKEDQSRIYVTEDL